MRIISGKYKGRQLVGKIPTTTRPTTDRVKESFFNILNNQMSIRDIKVLDICAGTGAIGIEALSRGAEFCVFIDNNRKNTEYIQRNLNEIAIPKNHYLIKQIDVEKKLHELKKELPETQYELIYLDPPYQKQIYETSLDKILSLELLHSDGILAVEHSLQLGVCYPEGYLMIESREFGDTIIDILEIVK